MKNIILLIGVSLFMFVSCSSDDDGTKPIDSKKETIDNLKAAITGETGATTKYAAFAEKALSEGYNNINKMFTAASEAEKVHIKNHNNALEKMGESTFNPTPPQVTPKTTAENLSDAIDGETYEYTDMYPTFIKAAQNNGFTDALRTFLLADKAETVHAMKYKYVLDIFKAKGDAATPATWYVCPICGNLHYTIDKLEKCEICNAPTNTFVIFGG